MYLLFYLGMLAFFFYSISLIKHYKHNIGKREEAIDKKVSIIIPAYNEEKSIAETIESALAVDYPEDKLEIVVVDDGSNDNTYREAKKFSKLDNIRVYSKKNSGKGGAINYGLKKVTGEIVFTMDADSFVQPDAVKKMVAAFDDKEVMCVSPSMLVYNPKTLWQKISHAEYFIGIFLRKSFSTVNSIHITPGAFSSYRKEFFDRYGGFDEDNITEDMELALRVQSKGYKIGNVTDARVYTIAPKSFRVLLSQRRRWYVGMIRNLWDYKHLFGPKTGILGTFVLPIEVISIILGIFLTFWMLGKAVVEITKNLQLLSSINFKFDSFFELNKYVLENIFYNLFSKPTLIMFLIFLFLLIIYMNFARIKSGHNKSMKFSLALFLVFYAFLFAFWWTLSFIYVSLNKNVDWGGNAS